VVRTRSRVSNSRSIAKGDMFALPAYVQSYVGGVLEQLPCETISVDWSGPVR
jgi:hypothetical protein